MRNPEQLHRRLPKMRNLQLGSLPECVVLTQFLPIHLVCISQVKEDIMSFLGVRQLLLEAKNEVDPLVQVRAHVLALQRLGVLFDKVGRPLGPGRQRHVPQALPCVAAAQVQVIRVEQKVAAAREELGDELLQICGVE